jgi:hypothetical protein
LFPLLFQSIPLALYWRIDFQVQDDQANTGQDTLTLKANSLPMNGNCFVDKSSGTSLSTWFNILCTNWNDLDGQIMNYEYLSKKNFEYFFVW